MSVCVCPGCDVGQNGYAITNTTRKRCPIFLIAKQKGCHAAYMALLQDVTNIPIDIIKIITGYVTQEYVGLLGFVDLCHDENSNDVGNWVRRWVSNQSSTTNILARKKSVSVCRNSD